MADESTDTPSEVRPYDDDWILEDDNSLEHYVRHRAADDHDPEEKLVRLDMRLFPVEVLNAMEYIHSNYYVPTRVASGHLKDLHPSYTTIYIGAVDCGLRLITSWDYNGPSRKQMLESDSVRETIRRRYNFSENYIFRQGSQRLTVRLTEKQVARLRDLSNDLAAEFSHTVVAVFVAGISKSDDWLVPGGTLKTRWVERCDSSLKHFWQYVETKDAL